MQITLFILYRLKTISDHKIIKSLDPANHQRGGSNSTVPVQHRPQCGVLTGSWRGAFKQLMLPGHCSVAAHLSCISSPSCVCKIVCILSIDVNQKHRNLQCIDYKKC